MSFWNVNIVSIHTMNASIIETGVIFGQTFDAFWNFFLKSCLKSPSNELAGGDLKGIWKSFKTRLCTVNVRTRNHSLRMILTNINDSKWIRLNNQEENPQISSSSLRVTSLGILNWEKLWTLNERTNEWLDSIFSRPERENWTTHVIHLLFAIFTADVFFGRA